MVYFWTSLFSVLFLAWSYIFIKTYQLSGYKISQFFDNVLSLNLSFGDKNKLNFTKRMLRFIGVYCIISISLIFLIFYFIKNIWLIILDIALIFLLEPIILVMTHYFLFPLEIMIKKWYMYRAKKKLSKKQIVKIGITGSYGKTSTKNILAHILEKQYKVCITPKNYNTEMGLTKTILSNLDDHDIFIAEMGARHVGDIEVLAKMVKPDYAILTTIGNQHIETFKNLETIENTKFELVKNVKEDGIVIFNGDSPSTRKLYEKYKGEKFLTCEEDSYAYAENIETNSKGSKFDLILDGKCLNVQTRLLGKFNINNIVTAAALAHILNISDNDIVAAIKSLVPTPHRLELLKNEYCTIIDDSYNSNIVGSKEAMEVLSSFNGVKIVVTPGIVELGAEQSQANFKLGTYIADVADYLIIMNNVNKNELFSGAISHNFKKERIYMAETRKKQKEILKLITCKDCVVLFENDLPDNYK